MNYYEFYYVGLDVHSTSFSICFYQPLLDSVLYEGIIKPSAKAVKKSIDQFIKAEGIKKDYSQFIIGYEAGCLGYIPYYELTELKLNCIIMAPNSIVESSKCRGVKNDRRDAQAIAKALAKKQFSPVYVPDKSDLEVKEFIRTRDFFKEQQKRFKQAANSLALRNGFHYEKTTWTQTHFSWLWDLPLPQHSRECLNYYLLEISHLEEIVAAFDKEIEEISQLPRYRDNVKRLICLKGINIHTALALITEVGDFHRFRTARNFSAYLGLLASENSSNKKHKNGSITKEGNKRLRKLLTESAQQIGRGTPGKKTIRLRKRQEGAPPEVIQYADRCNLRLTKKAQSMRYRQKSPNKIKTAIASELACFIWGMMTDNIN